MDIDEESDQNGKRRHKCVSEAFAQKAISITISCCFILFLQGPCKYERQERSFRSVNNLMDLNLLILTLWVNMLLVYFFEHLVMFNGVGIRGTVVYMICRKMLAMPIRSCILHTPIMPRDCQLIRIYLHFESMPLMDL